MLLFNVARKRQSTYRKPKGIIYRSPSAAYYYNRQMKNFLSRQNFVTSYHDPWLYIKVDNHGTILVSNTIDGFFVLTPRQSLIDEFYAQREEKYQIQRSGKPTRFFSWTSTYNYSRSVHLSHQIPSRLSLKTWDAELQSHAHSIHSYQDIRLTTIKRASHIRAGDILPTNTAWNLVHYVLYTAKNIIHHKWIRLAHGRATRTPLAGTQRNSSLCTERLLLTAMHTRISYATSNLSIYSDSDYANSKNPKSI